MEKFFFKNLTIIIIFIVKLFLLLVSEQVYYVFLTYIEHVWVGI